MSFDEQLAYKIAFASIRGMGYDLATKMLDVISSEESFFTMPEKELKSILGGRSRIYLKSYRQQQLEKAVKEIDFIKQNNIDITYFTDDGYPKRLTFANDAPILLYSCGKCNLNSTHVISIVGTRHATAYGMHFCNKIVEELSQAVDDLVIVSGLAYGIDISAHRAALQYSVPTVAVMAQGLNKIYPAEHRDDAVAIVRHNGMLLTDYMSQDVMHKGNFLARNRIIAGLADCTLVVESARMGGALVTARLAANYNRDVFAVPGRISDEFSSGCNRIIRTNQAQLVNSGDDICYSMNWLKKERPQLVKKELFPQLTEEQNKIISVIKQCGDVHVNTIAEKITIPIYKIMSSLMELECKGIVMSMPGCRYTMAQSV